ncbi:MAG: hypothetical protein ACRDJO_09145 [Actinomycetota bacterium]
MATVGRDGTPHVTPVGWSYSGDLDVIEIRGHSLDRHEPPGVARIIVGRPPRSTPTSGGAPAPPSSSTTSCLPGSRGGSRCAGAPRSSRHPRP